MITKKFGVDFESEGGALTLPVSAVTDLRDYEYGKKYSRTHESGWTITGAISEDYFEWVNDFTAVHPVYGRASGNFEGTVRFESEEAFNHFWKNHEPDAWDYSDI